MFLSILGRGWCRSRTVLAGSGGQGRGGGEAALQSGAPLRKHSCHSRRAPPCIMGAGGRTAKRERGKGMSHSAAPAPVAPPPPIVHHHPPPQPAGSPQQRPLLLTVATRSNVATSGFSRHALDDRRQKPRGRSVKPSPPLHATHTLMQSDWLLK